MNRSKIFSTAHRLAKKGDSRISYKERFSNALKESYKNYMIQETKFILITYAFQYGWNKPSIKQLDDEAQTVIHLVASYTDGFASDIANTCLKYKKVSEKQAYWIAKCAVETNNIKRIKYLF